jgi:hypothetical protein
LVNRNQVCPPSPRPQAFFGELSERQNKIFKGGVLDVEDMYVKVKRLSLPNAAVVKVGGAKYERAGPVSEPAWSFAMGGLRFEDESIWTTAAHLARACVLTIGHADELPE